MRVKNNFVLLNISRLNYIFVNILVLCVFVFGKKFVFNVFLVLML